MRLTGTIRLFTLILLIFISGNKNDAFSQVTQKSGSVSFFSSTPVEDIKAENSSFTSSINQSDSSVVFRVPITGFVFRKRLMQQHFNEQYLESDKFPVATFRGKLSKPLPGQDGSQSPVQSRVTGTLTIRDVSREIDEVVVFTPSGSDTRALCEFTVRPADYGIKIPRILIKNIAEEVKVTINVLYTIR